MRVARYEQPGQGQGHAPRIRAGAEAGTSSYVLVETYALLGRRIGLEAVAAFRDDFAPLLDVAWVDPATHDAALEDLLDRGTRDLSLVDVVSFIVMRGQGIDEAFAFDRHFELEGFATRA